MTEPGSPAPDRPSAEAASQLLPARTCLLVLGMHRSGTSALTRVLSLMGAALPGQVIAADPNNEAGYWEPTALNTLNNQLLAEAGSRWDDWRSFDMAALSPDRRQHYRVEIGRHIAEEFGAARLFVLKDPRISRFAPFYAEILEGAGIEAKFVLACRNPLSVIASLGKRDGATPGFAALLWLRHQLDAERATRTRPRVIVSYEALLADWRAQIGKLGEGLPLSWPHALDDAAAEIDGFLRKTRSHHPVSDKLLFADEQVSPWVKHAYAALKMLEQNPRDAAAEAILDRVKAEFDAVAPVFGAAFFPELDARQAAFSAAAAALSEIDSDLPTEFADRLTVLQAALHAAKAANLTLTAELHRRTAELHVVEEKKTAEIALITANLDQKTAEVVSYVAEIQHQRMIFKQLTERLADKLTLTANKIND